jgi:hypothetical protein
LEQDKMSDMIETEPTGRTELPRWRGTFFYRSRLGLLEVAHNFEELEELPEIVERGPNWYALDRIEIRLTDQNHPEIIERVLL